MGTSPPTTGLHLEKHFTSPVLLWVRSGQSRQTGMDYWKRPHSGIIAATPGLEEYRQIHLAEHNPGLWPATTGVETAIPADRKIDGIAEVTFQSALSPLKGRKETALAYKDEVNVFRRTLLNAGPPNTSHWYHVASPAETVGARAIIYLRRCPGIHPGEFRRLVKKGLVPALADTGMLKELRTQSFMPWIKKTWDTLNVAHHNPSDQRFHASIIVGFANNAARATFFDSTAVQDLSHQLKPLASAIHAYEVEAALTYVKHSQILPHYEE
ncbi:strictosidine synthase [Arthrobacter sp. 2RAF6]|uniref:strictosidine synthase n=1 Tax=Arthrobacter sp. 2RAF6 TaxID=3233002 RepID=UPI003F93783A